MSEDKLQKAFKVPVVGLRARRMNMDQSPSVQEDYSKFEHKLALIFDDSGSMSGRAIEDAKKGVEAFIHSLNTRNTAIAIYPLCTMKQPLTNDLALLYAYVIGIEATGGTPIMEKLKEVLEDKQTNRIILFSDGCPNHAEGYDDIVARLKLGSIKVDTVYIGIESNVSWGGSSFMHKLAEDTGGIYLHFDDSTMFGKSFRYLAPAFRGLLESPEMRRRVEKGEV